MGDFSRAARFQAMAMLGLFMIFVFLVRTYVVTVVVVDGQSMAPTLKNGQPIVVTMPDLWITGPKRGDIVICRYPGYDGWFVKRVIALQGDTVMKVRGQMWVNGARLSEPYVAQDDWSAYGPFIVPDGTVFVLGDNRADSLDSRAVGCLTQGEVLGRVCTRG